MHWSRPVLVVGIAVVATAAAAVLLRPWADEDPRPAAPVSTSERASGLATLVARTEERVARVPGDWRAWADLGMARVQLARISGDPAEYPRAEEALRTSLDLRADGNAPALTGMAALAAARHDFGAAEAHARKAIAADGYSADAYGALADALIELGRPADARAAVKAAPTPEDATALGDLLTAGGDEAGAEDAYDLVRAAAALTTPDVDLVLFWADNGEADRAATPGRTIYRGRPSTVVADALGWALHRSGRSAEALPYADKALALGTRDARTHFHRGVIRAAVGDRAGARADLTEALEINPRFSPRDAPAAHAALAELGA